jgi:hypothetical protein
MESDERQGGSEADLDAMRRWDRICDDFEAAWANGGGPDCRAFLGRVPAAERAALLSYLLPMELEWRHASTAAAVLEGFLRDYPEYPEAVMAAWESHRLRDSAEADEGPAQRGSEELASGTESLDAPSPSSVSTWNEKSL